MHPVTLCPGLDQRLGANSLRPTHSKRGNPFRTNALVDFGCDIRRGELASVCSPLLSVCVLSSLRRARGVLHGGYVARLGFIATTDTRPVCKCTIFTPSHQSALSVLGLSLQFMRRHQKMSSCPAPCLLRGSLARVRAPSRVLLATSSRVQKNGSTFPFKPTPPFWPLRASPAVATHARNTTSTNCAR